MSAASPSAAIPGSPSSRFFVARWIFLRLLGVVYLAAFLSLWVQIDGLVGSRGILPIADYLTAVRTHYGSQGFYLWPTLCWIDTSDAFLNGLCLAGAALSGLLILGLTQVPVLVLLWALYLSVTMACQLFCGYQWDALLLETGFLAIFLAPWQLVPRPSREKPPHAIVLWLLRWLLFRLLFTSGAVKLLSGDPSWRDLTALHYHYETQPLPTWTSWYMQQLPAWFQAASVLFTFAAELLVPLLIFGPRRARQVAFAGIVGLQLLIAATGNYGFFNLLAIALCFPLLDDACFPAKIRSCFGGMSAEQVVEKRRPLRTWLLAPLATVIVLFSLLPFLDGTQLAVKLPESLQHVRRVVAGFESINTYGLFAVMTTRRPEIIIEGSNDGTTWLAYEFRWKPGDATRAPRFAGLHMPRLDWQMWFAAMNDVENEPWFYYLMKQIQEGSPPVLALLKTNPFPDAPPRYLRATLYQYHFTDRAARRQTRAWWRRVELGPYSPVLQR